MTDDRWGDRGMGRHGDKGMIKNTPFVHPDQSEGSQELEKARFSVEFILGHEIRLYASFKVTFSLL
jgi:hypothetical protein